MSAEGVLLAIAEIGVALAGFAALVALFRRTRNSWSPPALSALRFMIEQSLYTVMFALVPTPLALAALSDETVWLLASAGALIVGIGGLVLNTWRVRRLVRGGWKPPTWAFHTMGFSVACLVLAGLVANLWFRGPALYVSALIGSMFLVGLQFVAFVSSGGDSEPA